MRSSLESRAAEAAYLPTFSKRSPIKTKRASPKRPSKQIHKGIQSMSRGEILPTSSSELSSDLPSSYNQTRLTFLARDPVCGYLYWDFSEDTWNWIQGLIRGNSGMKAKLRIHNMNTASFFDIDVSLHAKNWYVHLNLPDTEFEAELGLMGSDGTFHLIVRSNRIRTPRNRPSDVIDPEWAPDNFEELYKLSGGDESFRGSSLFSPVKKF